MSKNRSNNSSHATASSKFKTGQEFPAGNKSNCYGDYLLISISRKEVETRVLTETVKTLYGLYKSPKTTRLTDVNYYFRSTTIKIPD